MQTLILTIDNYLEFLEFKSLLYKSADTQSYFLQQLKKVCRVIPEFILQPTLCHYNKVWRYDSEQYWGDNYGRCSLRIQNSFFGFNDKVHNFDIIKVDCESFGIRQVSDKRIRKMAGVIFDYLTPDQQKLIEEQETKQERESRIIKLQRQCAQIIAELKTLGVERAHEQGQE